MTMINYRRLAALVRKELQQILRDPSAMLIAGVLPLLLIFIFGIGVSLDLKRVKLALVIEQSTPQSESLGTSFLNSKYFEVIPAHHRSEIEAELVAGRIGGIIVVAADFADRSARNGHTRAQLIVDGSDPNTASLVQGYVHGVWQNWLAQEKLAEVDPFARISVISVEPRFWFNRTLNSRDSLLPGSIAIVLTIIGTLLTSLVVAREWERGTMESLLASPSSRLEILLGKVIPYYLLGMTAAAIAVIVSVQMFDMAFRGSVLTLVTLSTAYLITMLLLGLLISTKSKNQFVACQASLIIGFLPAFELSGLIFEIDSMPTPIRWLCTFLPPRYFVSSMQTIFLAGDVRSVLLPNALILTAFAITLWVVLFRVTPTRLE